MRWIAAENPSDQGCMAAEIICRCLQKKPDALIAFPTGSTPLPMYASLVACYQSGQVDFSRMRGFNLDEYAGLPPEHPQSYAFFLWENFYRHVNVQQQNIFVLDALADPVQAAADYEEKLKQAGYPDLAILGIGINGHIGFNEPASVQEAFCHPVQLAPETLAANARFFSPGEKTPQSAVTMGMGSILKSRKIILLASGKGKAKVMARLKQMTQIDPMFPASFLYLHRDVTVIADRDAWPQGEMMTAES